MVGLGVVLEEAEPHKKSSNINNNNTHHVINKTTIKNKTSSPLSYPSSYHSPFKASTFLDQCFLCNKKLLLGKDIYMYKGDRAFCSVDCRCKHILADEEEDIKKQNFSLDGFD